MGPDDPNALAALGNWYAFRGKNDWAVELLQRARAHGANVDSLNVDSLTLARYCRALAADPRAKSTRDLLDMAEREFHAALAAAKSDSNRFT